MSTMSCIECKPRISVAPKNVMVPTPGSETVKFSTAEKSPGSADANVSYAVSKGTGIFAKGAYRLDQAM